MSEPLSLQALAPVPTPAQPAPSAHSDSSDSGSSTADASQFDAILQEKRTAMAPEADTAARSGMPPKRPQKSEDTESDASTSQNPLDQIAYSAGDSSVPVIALPILDTALQAIAAVPQAAMIAALDVPSEPAAIAAQPQVAAATATAQSRTAATGSDEFGIAAALAPAAAPAPGSSAEKSVQPARAADNPETAKANIAASRIAAAESSAGKNTLPPATRAQESAKTAPAAPIVQTAPTVQTVQTVQATDDRPAISERRRVTADTVAAAVANADARRDETSSYIMPLSETSVAEKTRNASSPLETMSRIDAASPANAAPVPVAAERAASISSSHVEPRIGERGWNQEFASQVTLLVSNREPRAEIRVNPQHLGPVEVRISMDGDKVSLMFTAAHPDTRAAIQDALPNLREMLADSGLSLGNASVSTESSQRDRSRPEFAGTARIVGDEAQIVDPAVMSRVVSNRLVDTFA